MRQQIYSIASLDRKTRKKMTNSSLWSIKIENGQVFIYLGKEKLKMHQVYRRVLSVKKSLFKGKDGCPAGKYEPSHLAYLFCSLYDREVETV